MSKKTVTAPESVPTITKKTERALAFIGNLSAQDRKTMTWVVADQGEKAVARFIATMPTTTLEASVSKMSSDFLLILNCGVPYAHTESENFLAEAIYGELVDRGVISGDVEAAVNPEKLFGERLWTESIDWLVNEIDENRDKLQMLKSALRKIRKQRMKVVNG